MTVVTRSERRLFQIELAVYHDANPGVDAVRLNKQIDRLQNEDYRLLDAFLKAILNYFAELSLKEIHSMSKV